MTIGEAARRSAEPDLERLEFIRQAKALGLTLDAVRDLVAAVSSAHGTAPDRVRAMLDDRIAHVTGQIETLTQLKRELLLRRRRLTSAPRGTSRWKFCTCLTTSHRA